MPLHPPFPLGSPAPTLTHQDAGRSPRATRPPYLPLPTVPSPPTSPRSPSATSTLLPDESPSSGESRRRARPDSARYLVPAPRARCGPGLYRIGAPHHLASPGRELASAQPQPQSALHDTLDSSRCTCVRFVSGDVSARCTHTTHPAETAQVPVADDRSSSSACRCLSAVRVSRLRGHAVSLTLDWCAPGGRSCRPAPRAAHAYGGQSPLTRARSHPSWPAPPCQRGALLGFAWSHPWRVTWPRRMSVGPCSWRAAHCELRIPLDSVVHGQLPGVRGSVLNATRGLPSGSRVLPRATARRRWGRGELSNVVGLLHFVMPSPPGNTGAHKKILHEEPLRSSYLIGARASAVLCNVRSPPARPRWCLLSPSVFHRATRRSPLSLDLTLSLEALP